MKYYGVDMQGKFHGEEIATLPTWISSDERRIIYVADEDKYYYGTGTAWKEFGTGASDSESDKYQDLLANSYYTNITWDSFETTSLVDTGNSNMTYNNTTSSYEFTSGQILQSTNLYDPILTDTVTECMVVIDYIDGTGSQTLEVTADGSNWESCTELDVHTFSNTGTDVRIRLTGVGDGVIKSWAIFYIPDLLHTYYGLAGDTTLKLWVYKNTAVTGWAIDGTVYDQVLAMKGGTTYTTGGVTAGTWTQPNHTLTTAEMPIHNHTITKSGAGGYLVSAAHGWDGAIDGSSSVSGYDMSLLSWSIDNAGGSSPHNHGTSYRPSAAVGTMQYPSPVN